ncbi:hypothetical protein F6X37_20200 [Paraburkholderia sp. 31.1]|uniref:hypothetical protein n=1 Tax=Paraburkholderia sp. 31.1 TaxID=2615205 RepID=UPI00165508A3|nr:hypothetical protein [Paraburkholderia sp. 31.1]MBC8723813.1 hypothetical protein [Paraburkholderia sp. 31.1]
MDDHEIAKALYNEVKNGNLLFVPERDQIRKCVQAIREQRERASRPVPGAQERAEADMVGSLRGNTPRVPQSLGNAQPFTFQPEALSDDVQTIAARGVSEAHEAECFAKYEQDMMACDMIGATFRDSRTYLLCKRRAFSNYQTCRGF